MGQRHQIFVKITNPIPHLNLNKEDQKRAEKEFGTGKFSIIAYHNQWLYGRSALQNCLNILKFSSQFTKDTKATDKSYNGYDCPFSPNGYKYKFDTTEKITTAIGFIMNFRVVKTAWLEAGIGGSWYIGKTDEGINSNFMLGDNNDGITIVDAVENKYCFMNINNYKSDDELCYSASDLPYLQPVGAREYVAAYYGETIETTNPYYFGDHDRSKVTMSVDKQQGIVNKTIKVNNKAVAGFKKFTVLTHAEIKAMFPKMTEFPLTKSFAK